MRKTIAIFLLFSFALYHFGYYVAYFSFRLQIENNWAEKIYSEHQDGFEEKLMEIPLSVPYLADQEDFQITNTSFEKDGQYFRVIRQKYAKDTLQLVYVPDTAKKNLDQTIKQWISSLVQDEVPDGTGSSLLSKIFLKDYTRPVNGYDFSINVTVVKNYTAYIFLRYQNNVTHLNSPPPEVA